MTHEEVKNLRPGVIVYWQAPETTACRRAYEIKFIEVQEGSILLEDLDGTFLECPPEELYKTPF